MDSNTGRIRSLDVKDAEEISQFESGVSDLDEKLRGLEMLPPHLERAARKKLNGRKEAYVSLTSGGKLSRYAASVRKKKKKIAKESRKINRK